MNEVFKREYDVRFSGVNARLYTGGIPSNSGRHSVMLGIKRHWATEMELVNTSA